MSLHIDILTLFPDMFSGPLSESILKRAQEKELLSLKITDVRDFSHDKHRTADDYPFGGGAGMLMKPEPIFEAVEHVSDSRKEKTKDHPHVVMMCPQGKVLDQKAAQKLSKKEHLILICGRYEGIDERVRLHLVDEEVSIGDYVLSGGELPAMVLIDAVARLIPGVVGAYESVEADSFTESLLDYPQYTRPREYRGLEVPAVLLSGDHERIRRWRRKEAIRRTYLKRPDLLKRHEFSKEDKDLLEEIKKEIDDKGI